MISKIIVSFCLLAAARSQNDQYNGDLEAIVQEPRLIRTSPASVPSSASGSSPLTGSRPAVNIVVQQGDVNIVLPLTPYANIDKNSQYNNEWASIVRLLQLLRESPAGLPSSPAVSSPPSGVSCSTNDVTGVCVELRKCPYASQEIQNRKTLEFCGYTGSEPLVCCVLPSTNTTSTSTSTSTTPEPALTTTKSNDDVTENDVGSEHVTTESERKGCGGSYPRVGVNNGTSGGEVQYEEFPWMCAILQRESATDGNSGVTTRDVFVRAGALIHPAVVLTNGYKLDTLKQYRVRAGVGSGASTAGGRRNQLRDVETVVRKAESPNFLALLFLTAPMTLAPNVAVTCLPAPGQRVPPGATYVVTTLDNKWNEARLLKVPVSELDRHSCEREFIRTGCAHKGYKLPDSLSCMTLPGRERAINETMCLDMWSQYSPVSRSMESEDDRYMLSGFVWYRYNCASDPLWDYINISQLRDWIDEVVTAQGYHTTTYSVGSH